MREKGLIVDGFHFGTNKEYNEAKDELEAVEYIRNNTDLSKPRTVLKLYNELVENRTFHTPIGYHFLKELQNIILQAELVKTEDIDGIYISSSGKSNHNDYEKVNAEHYKHMAEEKQSKLKSARIINLFLVLTILIMIGIAIYSDKTVFRDFENKLIDRYASWEEELKNWEKGLEQREEALQDATK